MRSSTPGITQTLFEQETPKGSLAVYQTDDLGRLLTLNGCTLLAEQDAFIYHEMLTHPALFTYGQPKKVALIGHGFGLLPEILKHQTIQEIACVSDNALLEKAGLYFTATALPQDARIHYHFKDIQAFLANCESEIFDIIIVNDHHLTQTHHHQLYHRLLAPDGILTFSTNNNLLQLQKLAPLFQPLQQMGFNACQLLHFPQPSFATGWRTVVMATKRSLFKRMKEKDIHNRNFDTRYYNFDMHKAALALPEFIKQD